MWSTEYSIVSGMLVAGKRSSELAFRSFPSSNPRATMQFKAKGRKKIKRFYRPANFLMNQEARCRGNSYVVYYALLQRLRAKHAGIAGRLQIFAEWPDRNLQCLPSTVITEYTNF